MKRKAKRGRPKPDAALLATREMMRPPWPSKLPLAVRRARIERVAEILRRANR